MPTVFIRLTGCPLRCSYCDTAYAFTGGKQKQISAIIRETESYRTPYVTVTGGEPLAQSGCLSLLCQLSDKGFSVSLETSGALDISAVDPRIVKIVDLKTPGSGEVERNLLHNIEFLNRQDQVKFVICDEQDYQWAKTMLEEFELADRCEVLFSPAVGLQDPTRLAEQILRDNLAVRFQIQLHKLLWGDIPGK